MNLRRAWWLGSAIALCAVIPDAQSAQQPPTERPAVAEPTPQPATPVSRRAKTVLGSKIHIQGNVAIGTVDDIVFNDEGVIEYLVVLNDGKLVAVPWQAAKFNFDNRIATVNITQDRFREIPTFTVQTYPNFYEPAYRTQIYKYYGIVPPRLEQRRIERRERP
jgi:PRC-barrel domain